MPGRACGACTACCKIPEIDAPDLKKAADAMCPNCTGAACSIYNRRPEPCRDYFCVWRHIGALPDAARPDRLGVMLHLARRKDEPNLLLRVYIKAQPVTSWDDVSMPAYSAALAVLRRARLPVWRQDGDLMQLEHPSEEIAQAIANRLLTVTPQARAEAEAWIAIHAHY